MTREGAADPSAGPTALPRHRTQGWLGNAITGERKEPGDAAPIPPSPMISPSQRHEPRPETAHEPAGVPRSGRGLSCA